LQIFLHFDKELHLVLCTNVGGSTAFDRILQIFLHFDKELHLVLCTNVGGSTAFGTHTNSLLQGTISRSQMLDIVMDERFIGPLATYL